MSQEPLIKVFSFKEGGQYADVSDFENLAEVQPDLILQLEEIEADAIATMGEGAEGFLESYLAMTFSPFAADPELGLWVEMAKDTARLEKEGGPRICYRPKSAM